MNADLCDYSISRIERARREVGLKELELELRKLVKPKSIVEQKKKNQIDFEDMLFNMSKVDGQVKTEELERKSVYSFYRFRSQLRKYLEAKTKPNAE